ncbi:thioesterase family protein [Nocardioides sp. SOB77]|uniref:Thioesterase family protein n=1 Tax=Nocardioides oceani TaxID=3058369 RepID=A0ABT8FFV5_9ACTN|nr:acyl-CoA thioesterase domain-containing protein [Nocardioides oceani]MDN4173295.1 thioesterase family protein [Nocardioides oceani]
MELAFFTSDDDGESLVATDLAVSSWGADHLHGVAVSGAMARALEHRIEAEGRTDLRPARYTADLFRPASRRPLTFTTEVVRAGPRLALLDVVALQDGTPVARASGLFLKPTGDTEGEVWMPGTHPSPPPEDVAPPTTEPHVPFLHSDAGWSQDFREHQNASRKTSWNSAVPVVAGEAATPFQAIAAIADGASLVTNWGTRGVEHINTDITLTLVRRPAGTEIGLHAVDRLEEDGIAVGTATVFDRRGALGTIVLASLANARRTVDLGKEQWEDDGRRTTSGA